MGYDGDSSMGLQWTYPCIPIICMYNISSLYRCSGDTMASIPGYNEDIECYVCVYTNS